jgi:hypothetical protein
MTSHRLRRTLEDVFEERCSESGVTFEEEARELRIPAGKLRDKLAGRKAFTKPEAEKVGEFLGPDLKKQLLTFGPNAAQAINANLRNEEFIRLLQLPDEEREAEFESDPELRKDFEEYANELATGRGDSELRMAKEEIQRQGAENPGGYLPSPEGVGGAIEEARDRYQRELAECAGETLKLVKEGRYRDSHWRPATDFLESAGIKKDKFSGIEKGTADPRLSEIAGCSFALGIPLAVFLGELSDEEYSLVERFRDLSDEDRKLIEHLIDRLSGDHIKS